MVVVIVAAFVAAFVLADWCLMPRPRASREASPAATKVRTSRTAAMFLHPGHSWVRLADDGSALVGADDLACDFAGSLSAVELPRVGAVLSQGASAWALVSAKGRRLAQAMPLEGEVLEVNRELLEDPGLAQRNPYEEGWILKVRPTRLGEGLSNLLRGALAKKWLEISKSRITTRLSPELGMVATDGGRWASAFGDELDDADWAALSRELFPAADAASVASA